MPIPTVVGSNARFICAGATVGIKGRGPCTHVLIFAFIHKEAHHPAPHQLLACLALPPTPHPPSPSAFPHSRRTHTLGPQLLHTVRRCHATHRNQFIPKPLLTRASTVNSHTMFFSYTYLQRPPVSTNEQIIYSIVL